MAHDRSKEPRFQAGNAAARQKGLENPAEFPRMALLVRAAQGGDRVAVEALIAVLTPVVLHIFRAVWGTRRADLETLTREALLSIMAALPSWRGECTLLHFATRIAARRAVAAPAPKVHRFFGRDWLGSARGTSASAWEEKLGERRRALLRTVFNELPEAQGEAMMLRVTLGYSMEEIALISTVPVATVRGRLRLAKEALRARIEANPDWDELWGDDA